MKKDLEFRAFVPLEVRANGDSARVEGYAAVFGQDANIGGMWIERVQAGAFADTLRVRGVAGAQEDVVFVVNHGSTPLARTRSGTLTLSEDSHGLKMATDLNLSDPDHVAVYEKLKRGDLDRMSFAFRATEQSWVDGSADMLPVRTIVKAELYDVSVVTDPAYAGTDIGLRALDEYRAQAIPSLPTNKPNVALSRLRMKSGLLARLS
jgi:HK97 family phage prohead protease